LAVRDEYTERLAAAVKDEREACAKACERVVDTQAWPGYEARVTVDAHRRLVMEACAATIRARKP
jgi:hypothetical protein